ncbi:hypothetical protein ACSHWB_21695 [Lentzea sp. HUAS TT2]|uniref:hypothetical protein n=1 Tax=Lentzea sp. HUAS TT2 TaxID=3447454 RepID=UPI003F6FAA13
MITAVVVGLTFLFGFGNVLSLALRLGEPVWVAPLIAPAVDLSILGLLLASRYLAMHGASAEDLRPLRGFTLFVSVVSLALNVAEPVLSGEYGKAAFDAVGPVLLIGWAEVGPQVCRRSPASVRLHPSSLRPNPLTLMRWSLQCLRRTTWCVLGVLTRGTGRRTCGRFRLMCFAGSWRSAPSRHVS